MDREFETRLMEMSLCLTDKQFEQFDQYYRILIEWNKVMNLTGITEYKEVCEKHFLDSLSIVKCSDLSEIHNIIDIGTGAGFPGIPIKIAFPDTHVVLLDSLNKRIRFLDEVIGKLNLKGIETIHGRAEDYAKQTKYREQFDLCVSRAVANLSTLSEYCLPYVKIDGYFIPYKSKDVDLEVEQSNKAISILGGTIEKIEKFQLQGTEIGRSLIKIKKIKSTAKKYPRKAGLPSKEPL